MAMITLCIQAHEHIEFGPPEFRLLERIQHLSLDSGVVPSVLSQVFHLYLKLDCLSSCDGYCRKIVSVGKCSCIFSRYSRA